MEKYYLTNLVISSSVGGLNVDLRRKVKLVEIHYARRPPSFGLVYFAQETGEQKGASIQLATLEISDNNVAQFSLIKRVDFGDQLTTSCLIDFDTCKALMLEGSSNVSCIVLSQDGNLFDVQLIEESFRCITSGCELLKRQLLAEGQFVQVKLATQLSIAQQQQQHQQSDNYGLHILSEKSYSLYSLSKGKLQLKHKYSISPEEWLIKHFKQLYVIETNPQVVLVEMNDSSLRIIQQSNCLASLNLTNSLGLSQQHFISSGESEEEVTLFSYGRSQLIAHSLLIQSANDSNIKSTLQQHSEGDLNLMGKDPDKLLPKEPSFELEKCWHLDLNDIDSVRSLSEEDEEFAKDKQQGYLCPMWSAVQLNPDDSMAKFLVVAHKFHLLIYSFEQRPSLPFSVVYDKSFLQMTEPTSKPQLRKNQSTTSNQHQSEFIDLRIRPRLMHNFKLIGAHPSDALFNSIFLGPDAHLTDCRHFPQLGLLIAITNSCDLLAFKCVSSQVETQRNSLYQQLVADSIRGGSLLTNQIELMQNRNHLLREDIMKLDSRSQTVKTKHLDRFITTELKMADELRSLYNISMRISNLIQANRVVVISTVSSSFLKPSNKLVKSAYVDENLAILEIHGDSHQQKMQIDLPIIISDGQYGQLKVYYILRGSDDTIDPESIRSPLTSFGGEFHTAAATTKLNTEETISRAHSVILPIKGLMSYKPIDDVGTYRDSDSLKLQMTSCRFTGSFSKGKMINWLEDCFQVNVNGEYRSRFSSAVTQCLIECNIGDNQATILSNDLAALELIKRQVLKRATDDSIKLIIN